MIFSRPFAGVVLALCALGLGGCATAPKPPSPTAAAAQSSWTGRLGLQVENNPGKSFSAAFDLRGSPAAGELTLFSPLGGTLATMSWAPGAATLRAGSETRQFESLDALAAQATGTPIPVAALFDWLAGVNTAVPGWEADLSGVTEGRIHARRVQPPPAADLRVAFDR